MRIQEFSDLCLQMSPSLILLTPQSHYAINDTSTNEAENLLQT